MGCALAAKPLYRYKIKRLNNFLMENILLRYEKIIYEIAKVFGFTLIIRLVLLGSNISLENLNDLGNIIFTIINFIFFINAFLFIRLSAIHKKRKEKLNIDFSGYDLLISLLIVLLLKVLL